VSAAWIRAKRPTRRWRVPFSRGITLIGGWARRMPPGRPEVALGQPRLHWNRRICRWRNRDSVRQAGPATGKTGIACPIQVAPVAVHESPSESRLSRWRISESGQMAQAATRGSAGLGKARPVPVAPLRVGMEWRCCHPRNPRSTRISGGAGGTTAVPYEAQLPRRAHPLIVPDLAMLLGRFAKRCQESAIPQRRRRRSRRNFGFAGRGCRSPDETEDVGLAGPRFRADKTLLG
jgi:hypothetical protein